MRFAFIEQHVDTFPVRLVDTGVMLVLPHFPCSWACTLMANQRETWIDVRGARPCPPPCCLSFRVLSR